jgi:hypothetical protein
MGRYYRVRYRALNAVGWSSYSPIAYILAADLPSTPSSPSIQIQGLNAVITWQLPYNGGSEITSAQVRILQSGGNSYTADVADCDASQVSTFYARLCTVPLATLRGSPWTLAQGEPVTAIIMFENEVGWSPFSAATILPPSMQSVPQAPSLVPQSLSAVTRATTIGVTFMPLASP